MTVERARLFDKVFSVCSLLLMMDVLVQLVSSSGNQAKMDAGQGYIVYQLLAAVSYAMTFVLLWLRSGELFYILRNNKLLLLLLLLSLVSALWSVAPIVTARRSIALVGTTFFSFYLVARFRPDEFVRLLAIALAIAAVLSAAFAIFAPGLGTHMWDLHHGSWRGVFIHKNVLGRIMALGVAIFVIECWYRRKVWALAGLLLCASLVLMSGSRSAWVVSGVTVLSLPVIWVLRQHILLVMPGLIGTCMCAMAIGAWVVGNHEMLFGLIGRNISFTGRVPLWISTLQLSFTRPWLGFGYGAFWANPSGPGQQVVWNLLGWSPDTAHNSLIDLLLDLGLVGIVVLGGMFIIYFKRTVVLLRRQDRAAGSYGFMFIVFILWYSISGTVIPTPNSITWVLFVTMLSYATMPYLDRMSASEDLPSSRLDMQGQGTYEI